MALRYPGTGGTPPSVYDGATISEAVHTQQDGALAKPATVSATNPQTLTADQYHGHVNMEW